MESKLKQLRKAMDSSTHKGVHFTEFHKNKIRNAVQTDFNLKPKKPNKFVVIAISTFAISLLFFFISTELMMTQNNNGKAINDSSDITNIEVGHELDHNGKEEIIIGDSSKVVLDTTNKENPFEKQLTRLDVQEVAEDGSYGIEVRITDEKTLNELKNIFEQVKWYPTRQVLMASREDIKVTLFMKLEENKPKKSFEYRIWFNEVTQTATILSTNLMEVFGTLDKENTNILKEELLKKR